MTIGIDALIIIIHALKTQSIFKDLICTAAFQWRGNHLTETGKGKRKGERTFFSSSLFEAGGKIQEVLMATSGGHLRN